MLIVFACTANSASAVSTEVNNIEEGDVYHRLLTNWDRTSGGDASLFQKQIDASRTSCRVSKHQSADRITIFEHAWSVLESVPEVMTKK